MSDVAGRHTALTWPSLLRPGGQLWVRFLLMVVQQVPWIAKPLADMSVIHFARWSVLRRLPGDRPRLPHPCLLFESNFDVNLRQYIEVFAAAIPVRFRMVWFTAYEYPGLFPTAEFHQWVEDTRTPAAVYYSAYPAATTRMVRAGLAVAERLRRFPADTRDLSDDEFAAAYRRMLADVQGWL